MMKRFVAPRDALELRIAQICEEVLGRWIGVKDALVEDAGDLAAATAVLHEIEEQLDTALPLSTVQEAPTIAAIACRLRPERQRLITDPLVALQPNGSRRPFFFLPGGDGNVFNFHDLARRLAPDQPFYGLQTRGLYGEEPFDRFEELAAAHVEAIRAVQPHGPYLLGGHCTGACIALEMALQLERRGERVALLAAIDALAPSIFQEYALEDDFLSDPIDLYLIIARGLRDWFGSELPIHREALRSLEPGRRAAHFMALARGLDVYPEDAGDDCVDHVLDIYRRVNLNLNSYTPAGPISGRIVLFRGRDSFFCTPATGQGGWEGASREPIRVHELPGNHVTLVTEPHVAVFSQQLREEIAEAGIA